MSQLFETSEDIVAGINKGDREAETAMIKKYGRALIYILERRTGDKERAKDLQQETFLIVLQKLRREPITDPTKLAAYLQRTAVNLYIGEVRKDIRRNTNPDSEIVAAIADTQEDQLTKLLKDRSKFAIRQLINELGNDRDRKILMLYYIHEHEKSLVCEELNLSTRHFDRVISRARSRFRELVENNVEKIPLEVIS